MAQADTQRKRGTQTILTDHETKVGLPNNEAIAATVIGLLRERPDRPVTVGAHGDQGAGESSVLEMIEGGLSGKDEVCRKFNGWRFQGFEDPRSRRSRGAVHNIRPWPRKLSGVPPITSGLQEMTRFLMRSECFELGCLCQPLVERAL